MNFADFNMPPVEPSSDARQAAVSLFGIYTAWRAVGFTEAQAMTLLQTILCARIGRPE